VTCGGLLVFGGGGFAFFDEGGGAENVEGERLRAGGLEGDADGEALPLGGLADGNEVVGLGPGAEGTLDYGAAGSKLRYYGDEAAFGGGGDSTVGGVVPEPDGVGYGGIEVGQVEGGDVAGGTVDEQPGAGLPDPVRSGVRREGVVETEGAADGEAAIRDVVELAGGPLFLAVVDDEGADLQGGGLVGLGIRSRIGLSVGDAPCAAEGDGVDLGGRCVECGEEAERQQQLHGSGTKYLHPARVRGRGGDFKRQERKRHTDRGYHFFGAEKKWLASRSNCRESGRKFPAWPKLWETSSICANSLLQIVVERVPRGVRK
jgi:hypothetical protein